MNRDQIKGKFQKIKGDLKQRIGGASKERKTEAEGWLEEKEGEVRGGVGDVEERIERERERRREDPERGR